MLKQIILPAVFISTAFAGSLAASVKSTVDDAAITVAVKANLLKEKSISASNVKVSTQDGIVKLQGNVKSHTEANKMIEIAASANGAKDVDVSSLTVAESDQPVADAVITAKVKGLIVKEAILGKPVSACSVHVETKEGVVYLSGRLKNKAQENTAINLAKSVCGVKDVNSAIELKDKG